MPTLSYAENIFTFQCPFKDRELARGAGFRWDSDTSTWYTYDLAAAMRLREYADTDAKDFLSRHCIEISPWKHALPPPPDGLELMPHQVVAIQFALERNHSYLALDPGCIAGDAVIVVNRGGGARKMTLAELHQKFHGGVGKTGRSWDLTVPTKISSVNRQGILTLNTVVDVLDKGARQVIEITARRGDKTYKLRCTLDHPIMVSAEEDKWVDAWALRVGDTIKTNGLRFCEICKTHTDHTYYEYAKYTGQCKTCVRKLRPLKHEQKGRLDKDGYLQVYGHLKHHPRAKKGYLPEHVLKFEAHQNGVSYKRWLRLLKVNEIAGRFFVPNGYAIHHKNGVKTDNRISNLEMLTHAEHVREHKPLHRIKSMVVADAVITGIKSAGSAHVYDIVMADPLRNFIADGVVVHNCGKTICAAMIARALGERVVYICPPFLLGNVMAEFRRWGAEDLIYLFADTMITRDDTVAMIRGIAETGHSDTIICDEAHRYKNSDSKRTQALFGKGRLTGLVQMFRRQIYMSGTPMPNRPIELYTVLSKAAPDTIDYMDYFKFGLRYCAGKRTEYGWDFLGASNMQELSERVIAPTGPFMLRQKKALLNLPPKMEEIFVVSADMSPRLAEMEKGLGERYAKIEDLIKHQLARADGLENGDELHTATYRRLLGVEKVKAAAGYIESILDETTEAVLVFAYHKEVIAGLSLALKKYSPIIIDGGVKAGDRQSLVKKFQESPTHRLMVGNYVAMGVGFTMTKATRVLFVEFSWVPGENSQASDRAHRIGQTKSVLVQYMVYRDSIDKLVIEALLRKQRAIDHI